MRQARFSVSVRGCGSRLTCLSRKDVGGHPLFDAKNEYRYRTHRQKPVKALSARCRMMVNNINKSASAKSLQPEWETGLRTSKKPTDFLIRALRVCERATLESRKGHCCNVTVAFLQAPLDLFRPIFGSQYVSVKFKRLIISVLEMSPKSLICVQVGCPLRISQAEKPKVGK